MEALPQRVTARSQWLEVMGGVTETEEEEEEEKGTLLGRFVGLRQLRSPDQGAWKSFMQASPPKLTACQLP